MSESNKSKSTGPIATFLQLPPSITKTATLAVAGMFSILCLLVFQPGLLLIEENLGALGWTIAPDSTVVEPITLVVIDEKSVAEVGPWPWQREDLAALIDAIDQAGAQLQLHDITYPESRPGDDLFLAAVAAADGVVISQTPALESSADSSKVGLLTHPLNGVACDAASGGIQIPLATGFAASTATFAAVPKGHTSLVIDSDGAVRKSPSLVCSDGLAFPALGISAFLQLGSSEQWQGSIEPGTTWFGPDATLTLAGYPGLDIPVDANGAIRVSYEKSPESFLAVSAVDVMQGNVAPGILDNAWVIVGVTAFGTGDIVPTPYSGAAYGVEIQARILASLLDVSVPYSPAAASGLMIALSILFALVVYSIAAAGNRIAAFGLPFAAVALPLAALAIHSVVLSSVNVWLGWIAPAIFGLVAASSLLLLELARTRLERARVFGNLNSYLPLDVAKEIAFSLPSSSVNAHRRDVTLLNADLRNFSAFGEARPPEEIAAVLHYFFTRATEIIESQGGRIQEFKGDSLLAIWDGADRDAATMALHSAKLMQESLSDSLLPGQASQGLEPLALGIGIEQGPVLIGSIGPAQRRSHTLLGDTVSITLRIQEMTAELAQPVLIGECAARQLQDEELESQGSYLLSGLRIPHTLFAPVDSSGLRHQSTIQPNLTVVSGGKR